MESEADTKADGRFSFKTLHDYVCNKQYPSAFSKGEKRALRKRAHYFDIVDGQLHYTLGVTQVSESELQNLLIHNMYVIT